MRVFDRVVLKIGEKGVLLGSVSKDHQGTTQSGTAHYGKKVRQGLCWEISHVQSPPVEVLSVTGAGDTLVGTLMTGLHQDRGFRDHHQLVRLVQMAVQAARLTLQSPLAVSELLSPEILK